MLNEPKLGVCRILQCMIFPDWVLHAVAWSVASVRLCAHKSFGIQFGFHLTFKRYPYQLTLSYQVLVFSLAGCTCPVSDHLLSFSTKYLERVAFRREGGNLLAACRDAGLVVCGRVCVSGSAYR